jgi:hypothetical protein
LLPPVATPTVWQIGFYGWFAGYAVFVLAAAGWWRVNRRVESVQALFMSAQSIEMDEERNKAACECADGAPMRDDRTRHFVQRKQEDYVRGQTGREEAVVDAIRRIAQEREYHREHS